MASRSVVLAAVCISFDVLLTFNFTHSRPFCPLATLFDFYATAASVLAHAPLSPTPLSFLMLLFFFFGSFYVIETLPGFIIVISRAYFRFFPDFKQIFFALSALCLLFRFLSPFSLCLLRQLHYTLSGDSIYA